MNTSSASAFLLGLSMIAPAAMAATPLLGNASLRPCLDLDGKWEVIVDPYETGYYDYRYAAYDAAERPGGGFFLDRTQKDPSELIEYAFGPGRTLIVPRDWNSQDAQLFLYEGTVWYRRKLTATPTAGARQFLHFGGANYETDVYLNGRKLGKHIGGFTPFVYEVTGRLHAGENTLIVRVDNKRHAEGVPTLNTDWWNYGGITRDVRLVEVPGTFIADHVVQLERGPTGRMAVRVQLDGPAAVGQLVHVRIPELGIDASFETDAKGVAGGTIVSPASLERWSPAHPRLYDVAIVAGTDTVVDRIGFRTIETRSHEILLNGEPIFFRGISIHEENPLRGGRACTREDARLLLTWARELGCNFARLAHYPHNEHMARLADEMGILLWEEIPVYWTIAWDNPGTLANARAQLAALIERDRNRASVVVWSVANETPVSEPRTRFLTTLVGDARALDGTRLVSAAMEVRRDPGDPDARIVDDPFGEFTDLISFNQYVGWYDGLPERCDQVRWSIHYDKPVFISEFGAGALAGLHADERTRFSEEFQEAVYRHTLPMLQRIPGFAGVTPWILVDFRSPRRLLPGVQDGWNRKGLIGENGERKKAFYVLKAFYDELARR